MREEILKKIVDNGALAVIRLKDGKKFPKVAEAIYKGGVISIELTMTTPNAFELLKEADKEFGKEMMLGMGSVIAVDDLKKAVDSGAKYIVSPIFKPELVEAAHKNNVLSMPGAFTPTEIQTAYEAGADVVKV